MRAILCSPEGEVVTRDVVDGRWTEPEGDAETVIGEGTWALPGLVDAHSHIARERLDYLSGDLAGAEERARESLRSGVMLLLDKGWLDDTAIQVARRVPEEERPDIEAAARIIANEGGYMKDVALEVGEGTFDEAIRDQARRGDGWVKLVGDWPRKGLGAVANFTEDQLRQAVEIAAEEGARVAIHTMARDVPSMAVRAGVHSIEHGLFLTADDVEALAARGGMWVPTILRVEHTIAQLGTESTGGRLLAEGLENVRRLLGLASEAGAHVLAGTDLVGTPTNVASEALKLIEYGLPAAEAVRAVSSSGLAATGRATDFAPGSPANAVLFPSNPYDEPDVLKHPTAVIRLGRLV